MNLVPTHSNCTSPMDYISHHALHSHIPVHHYTNHTAVTIHSSLWLPHHTCTSFSHSHKSSTQTLTQCEVLFSPVTFLSVLPFILLSLCLTPDCLTLELWTCACDLDLCLVLFTSLLCLWYSCYARWPLPVWFCRCLLNIYYCTWIPCLWPVFTVGMNPLVLFILFFETTRLLFSKHVFERNVFERSLLYLLHLFDEKYSTSISNLK